MRIGTPNFVACRLREARESRALPAIALADLVGISRQAISQYEHGDASPSPEILNLISEKLSIPVGYFLRPAPQSEPGVVFYRSMHSASKLVRARAERKYEWLRDAVAFLKSSIAFPAPNFPFLDMPEDPNYITNEMIEAAATATRRAWKLGDGPISNVVWLLENNGAIMARHRLDCEALDAFSEWRGGDKSPYIILGSDKLSAARSRLDAAHELGHDVLHRKIPKAMFAKADIFKLVEEQAFRFAGAFLLPESTFANSFRVASLDVFRSLKASWKVAIGAMIKRAENLDLISPEQARLLWMNRTRRGWRTIEPLDDTLEIEQPRFLRRSVQLLMRSGRPLRAELENHLGLNVSDIEAALGLLPGELEEDGGGPIRMIQPAKKDGIA